MSNYKENIKLGLVPSPDLPAQMTYKFMNDLPDFLNDTVTDTVNWQPEVIVNPIVGSAEYMNELMNKLIHLKDQYEWDYLICLTDLPHFMNKHVIVADINVSHQIALISIPSFGFLFMKKKIKSMIANILTDLQYEQTNETRKSLNARNSQQSLSFIERYNVTSGSDDEESLKEQTKDSSSDTKEEKEDANKDDYTQEDIKRQTDVRYIVKSKLIGQIRLLAGMTFANRPWNTLTSFKKIIVFALGTGIYITIFPTPWNLSVIYSFPRFIILMIITILGMVVWMIFAHQLWEKRTSKGDPRLRKLYNYTTISTLSGVILINYLILFFLFLATIAAFVPPGLFETGTEMEGQPTIKNYLQLTWLITSLGTIAGSIGTTSENENNIRQATYSYRQMARYEEIQNENNE